MGDKRSPLLLAAIAFLVAWSATAVYAQGDAVTMRSSKGIRVLDLLTNDIIYDPVSQRLYASVPGLAGPTLGNTISTINPHTGEIESSVFVGSEPGQLAVSDDGEYLYVGLDGEATVRRFHVPSHTAGLQFSLGSDWSGAFIAEDIEVVPGNSHAVVVSLMSVSSTLSPRHRGIAVFDDGIARPNTLGRNEGGNRIAYSETPDVLYGISGFGNVAKILVNEDGLAVLATAVAPMDSIDDDLTYAAGFVYSTGGVLFNADDLSVLEVLGVTGRIAPDPRHRRVYLLSYDVRVDTWTLHTFDRGRLARLQSRLIPGIVGSASNLITWGNGGLAFRTDAGRLYLLPELPVPDDDVVADLGPGIGTWKWMNDTNWEKLHAKSPEALATGDMDNNGQSDVLVDFGPDLGIWKRMNDAAWVKMHRSPPQTVAIADLEGNPKGGTTLDLPVAIPDNDLASAVSTIDVEVDVTLTDVDVRLVIEHSWVGDLWIALRSPAGTEVVLLDRPGVPLGFTGCPDDNMDVTFDDDAIVFWQLEHYCFHDEPWWYIGLAPPVGSLAAFNGQLSKGTWSLIVSDRFGGETGAIVDWELIATPTISTVVSRDDAVVSFPTLGTWRWMNDSRWLKLHKEPAEAMAVGDLDGNGIDDVVIDFGSTVGLWRWMNNKTWIKLHKLSPERLATGDLDGNGIDDVVIDFGPTVGLWRWMNNSFWSKLHMLSPETIATGDVDGNGRDDVVVGFATLGTWKWMNNDTWVKLYRDPPEVLAIGDLDENGRDDVVLGFAAVGTWKWMNDSAWVKLFRDPPEAIATGNLDGD